MRMFMLSSAFCALSVAAPAWAQDGETSGSEIVVTATRRAQNLQDVPLSVSAFSAEMLEKSGIEDTRQLMALAPSLTLNVTTSDSAGVVIRLRGVGSEAINPGLESSVGTYVDGVYRARSNLSLSSLPGIERVEVLRGPQGTLFGKNTSVGVISVATKSPSFDPSGDFVASFGNYNLQQYSGSVTGPLVGDTLAGRLDAVFTRRDGWLEDLDSGNLYRDKDVFTLRGQALWKPSDEVDARLILDVSHYDQAGPDTYVPTFYDPQTLTLLQTTFGVQTVLGLNSLTNTISEDRESRELNDQYGASLEVNWDSPIGTLTSVSGFRNWRNKQGREVDYSEIDLAYIPFGGAHQHLETFSQEFRLAGQNGPLDWLVGVYYAHENVDALYGYRIGRDLAAWFNARFATTAITGFAPGGVGSDTQFRQTTDSYSFFTHDIFEVTDKLSITGGVRYTVDEKDVVATWRGGNPACNSSLTGLQATVACLQLWDPRYTEAARGGPTYTTGKIEREWSGVLTAAYELTDAINTYVTVGRGYKAGGFVLDPAGFKPITAAAPSPDARALRFNPELSDHYEIGAKAQFFDRRLTINSAAFHTKLTDFQLSYNTGAALPTVNIPEVTTTGGEVEMTFEPTAALRSTFNVVYADAHFGAIAPSLGLPASVNAVQNRRLYNAPMWTVTGSAGWDDTVLGGSLRAFAYVDARYQSAALTERLLRANSNQEGFVTANARLGVGGPSENWTLELWSRNLFDERYLVSTIAKTFTAASNVGVPGEPRTYGVTLRTQW